MRCLIVRVRRALDQIIVAGGCTRAIDAWVGSLEPIWQFAVVSGTLLTIALAQAFSEEQAAIPGTLPPHPSQVSHGDQCSTRPRKEARSRRSTLDARS
jgi:hypothetical protein